jgi:hypothetical protein
MVSKRKGNCSACAAICARISVTSWRLGAVPTNAAMGIARSLFPYSSKLRDICTITGPVASTSRSAKSLSAYVLK